MNTIKGVVVINYNSITVLKVYIESVALKKNLI